VYDVCAAMRQQSERRRELRLARPHKRSHHFLDTSQACRLCCLAHYCWVGLRTGLVEA